jgi:hypothetical protein
VIAIVMFLGSAFDRNTIDVPASAHQTPTTAAPPTTAPATVAQTVPDTTPAPAPKKGKKKGG